jgi:hypothetical protein
MKKVKNEQRNQQLSKNWQLLNKAGQNPEKATDSAAIFLLLKPPTFVC